MTSLFPLYGRQKTVLIALIEAGGVSTPAHLRAMVGGFVGGHLHALRNRSLIEPWMDIVRVTPNGLAWYEEQKLA